MGKGFRLRNSYSSKRNLRIWYEKEWTKTTGNNFTLTSMRTLRTPAAAIMRLNKCLLKHPK